MLALYSKQSLKVLLVVALVAFVCRVDATCGDSLKTYLARDDIGGREYVYVTSPYPVSIVEGTEFAVEFFKTDGGLVNNTFLDETTANLTLSDSTIPTSSPTSSPRAKLVSVADRFSVTFNVLALILGMGAIQYLRKDFKLILVLVAILSMVNIIASQALASAPCPTATVTLHIPVSTVNFVCINNECVCGPGFTGDTCLPVTPPVIAPTCNDTIKNQDETDVDCGGECKQCEPGQYCNYPFECTSLVCTSNACQVAACNDTYMNQDETDTDCGGTICTPCYTGQTCKLGSDCISKICSNVCSNDICNYICQQPTCSDGVQNQDETDKDCGGSMCPRCPADKACNIDRDCASGVCTNYVCQQPSCIDNVKNGDESDTDCGGSCLPCIVGQKCKSDSDCKSALTCLGNLCTDTCSNSAVDGRESDVDCGGGRCPGCGIGLNCYVNRDCQTSACDISGYCVAP